MKPWIRFLLTLRKYLLSPWLLLFNKKVLLTAFALFLLYHLGPSFISRPIKAAFVPVYEFTRNVASHLGFFSLLGYAKDGVSAGGSLFEEDNDQGSGSLGGFWSYGGRPRSFHNSVLQEIQYPSHLIGYSNDLALPIWACFKLTHPVKETTKKLIPEITIDERTEHGVIPQPLDHQILLPLVNIDFMHSYHGVSSLIDSNRHTNFLPIRRGPWEKIWRTLHRKLVQEWLPKCGTLWVTTGCTLNHMNTPDGLFFILVDETDQGPRQMAFHLPLSINKGEKLSTWITPIEEIQELAGIDFFSNLKDEDANLLESETPTWAW